MRKLCFIFLLMAGVYFFSCKTMPKEVEDSSKVETSIGKNIITEESVVKDTITKEDEVLIEKIEEPIQETQKEELTEQEVIAEFGEVKITKKHYNDTMDEIKIVVEGLNKTTASKNYTTWLKFLSEQYKKTYSNPSILKTTSESLPVKGLKLNSLKDFFNYVFVPSRQKIKVDDIKFLSPVKVNVIMLSKKKELLVYALEKFNEKWLLVPGQ